jgi:hypothetical protein
LISAPAVNSLSMAAISPLFAASISFSDITSSSYHE